MEDGFGEVVPDRAGPDASAALGRDGGVDPDRQRHAALPGVRRQDLLLARQRAACLDHTAHGYAVTTHATPSTTEASPTRAPAPWPAPPSPFVARTPATTTPNSDIAMII